MGNNLRVNPPSVSVVIPALNEERTVAQVVRAALADAPYEVIVIDADSTDATAKNALQAGARVLNWREVMPDVPTRPGKGESLWRGVAAAQGDIVCFIDADVESATPGMVKALTQPFTDPRVALVRAAYARMLGDSVDGGRVTELCAKPLLETYFPQLSKIAQPLGGEYAIRRKLASELSFVGGYGVEAGLLIDVSQKCGAEAIFQVELPPRVHRNRPLHELAPMARVVAHTILERAGVLPEGIDPVGQRPPLKDLAGKVS